MSALAKERKEYMHNQSFSAEELSMCASYTEMRDFGYENIGELENDLKTNFTQEIAADTFDFAFKLVGDLCVNAKEERYYLYQNLLMRKMCMNIGSAYKVKQSNRNGIIRQMKSLLKAPCELYVLRLDIHHFYESINSAPLIEKLRIDGKVNAQTISYVDRVMGISQSHGIKGLPMGVGISAVLSEIQMKKFDYEMKRLKGVYYYARFVDDMILFCNSQEEMDSANTYICETLKQSGMFLNKGKTKKWSYKNSTLHSEPLEYLGYCFSKHQRGEMLQVSIAKSKINKIKTRLSRSFMAFVHLPDYGLLYKRLRYLTGNFKIHTTNSVIPQCVGIYYNYRYVDAECAALQELQTYYQNLLHCRKGKLESALHHLTPLQYDKLCKLSFVFGFKNHVSHHFNRSDINQISQIWR